jgi:hypothetical protein
MSIEKKFLKAKPVCKIKFSLSGDQYKSASSILLVGDFNNWKIGETPLKKAKTGIWSVSLDLETGKDYRFRYLMVRTGKTIRKPINTPRAGWVPRIPFWRYKYAGWPQYLF